MPSRSILNKTRGKQKAPAKMGKAVGMGELVSTYDGRANTNAGKYERQAKMQDDQGDGRIVEWKK